MKERPEPWAYEEFPDNPEAFQREFLANQRQQTAYMKQIIDGGRWIVIGGFALLGLLAYLT